MDAAARYPRIGSHRTVEEFRSHLHALGSEVPVDDEILAAPESPSRSMSAVGAASATAGSFTRWRAGTAPRTAGPGR